MADSGISTPTAVAVDDSPAVSLLAGVASRRRTVWLHNDGPNTVYIGGDDVTSARGLPIVLGDRFPIVSGEGDTDAGEDWYGICSSGQSASVRVLAVTR